MKETIKEVKITSDSIETELDSYKNKPYECLFEYVWNAFDAGATHVDFSYKKPQEGIGLITELDITDNGTGWDLDKEKNTTTFLASSKSKESSKQKTLPRGKLGRGRYSFIWLADEIHIRSKKKKAILTHKTQLKLSEDKYNKKGTKVTFLGINEIFSTVLNAQNELEKQLTLEFCWFLKQNNSLIITVNGNRLDPSKIIKETKQFSVSDFSDEVQKGFAGKKLTVEVVLWQTKPNEWSNYYFLDLENKEIFTQSTKLNKKADNFWHSVYVSSDIFDLETVVDDDADLHTLNLDPKQESYRKTKRRFIDELRVKITELRKPILKEQSVELVNTLKNDGVLPNLKEFGIWDEQSYSELLQIVYVISPSIFVGKSDADRKFICTTFASLLSTQDGDLIKKMIEQLQVLTEDEKSDLSNILEKTTLSGVVKTIKEVNHRIDVIANIERMLTEFQKETLEVKHIQKIIDDNFWLFGEQFRLFSTTEGAIKKVLEKYAKEILEIDPLEIKSNSKKEVDLFVTRYEGAQGIQKNIIVELKRPSIKLHENKEYAQIKEYCNAILEEDLCNSENQYWEFHLIGKDYDNGISGLINSALGHGEKNKGLTYWDKDGRVKIYVRKWSDILQVEWGEKMSYLKQNLENKMNDSIAESPDEVVKEVLSRKKMTTKSVK